MAAVAHGLCIACPNCGPHHAEIGELRKVEPAAGTGHVFPLPLGGLKALRIDFPPTPPVISCDLVNDPAGKPVLTWAVGVDERSQWRGPARYMVASPDVDSAPRDPLFLVAVDQTGRPVSGVVVSVTTWGPP